MPTPDEITTLHAKGLTAAEVARLLGVSRSTVYRACPDLVWPSRKTGRRPRLTRAMLERAAREHTTVTAAADALGCTRDGIYKAMRRLGVVWADLCE